MAVRRSLVKTRLKKDAMQTRQQLFRMQRISGNGRIPVAEHRHVLVLRIFILCIVFMERRTEFIV